MKQQTNPFNRKSFSEKKPVLLAAPIGIFADSWEVKAQYYQEKLAYFEHALVYLNVFEHAVEIVAICKEMKRYKEELARISERIKHL
jgi:hypothetical protein